MPPRSARCKTTAPRSGTSRFIPWFRLDASKHARPGGPLDEAARRHGATPNQRVALAWLLARSPGMVPIPGDGQRRALEDNVAAASPFPGEDDLTVLSAELR